MKKLLTILLPITILIAVCGCGKKDESEYGPATVTYDVMISDTDIVKLQVPADLTLTLQDNRGHYEFEDKLTIDMLNIQYTTAPLDEETGLYVTDKTLQLNVDDKCILLNCTGTLHDYMKSMLQKATRISIDTDTYVEDRLKVYPEYADVTMELQNGNMYMPVGATNESWMAHESMLYVKGTSWLQLNIMDGNFDTLKPRFLTLALCNSGSNRVDEWYQDDYILYLRKGDTVVVTKRLAYNSYYVYTCSADMKDYALKGAKTIYGSNGETLPQYY